MKRLAPNLCTQSDREGWPSHKLLEALLEHALAERKTEASIAIAPRLARAQSRGFQLPLRRHDQRFEGAVTALAEGHEWLDRVANVLLFGPPGVGERPCSDLPQSV